MIRDLLGNIQYSVEKMKDGRDKIDRRHYPHDAPFGSLGVFWECQRVRIKNFVNGKPADIIGWKFFNGPTNYKYNNSESSLLESFTSEVQKMFLNADYNSNCFGYAFCDGLFWIDPIDHVGDLGNSVIEAIIAGDGYINIDSPEKNSIALFRCPQYFTHVSKTDDGINWYGKNGPGIAGAESFEENLNRYKSVSFYKRS